MRVSLFALALTLLVFGLYNVEIFSDDPEKDMKWVWIACALYAVPIAGQLVPSPLVRVLTLWFGVFLFLQAVLSPLVPKSGDTYITLSPNKDYRLDVVDGAIPGIVGPQHITTDENGFRTQPKVNYQTKHALRIFTIGGSTTEEIYIDDNQTWSHLLQEHLEESLQRPVEVINTGVSGLRAVHHLATLNAVQKYEPDLAIILVGINDWNRAVRRALNKNRNKYNVPPFPATVLGKAITTFYVSVIKESKITSLVGGSPVHTELGDSYNRRRGSLNSANKVEYMPHEVAQEYADDIDALANACNTGPTDCLFLTQPNGYQEGIPDQYSASFWMTSPGLDITLSLPSLAHVSALYNEYLIQSGVKYDLTVFDLASRIAPGFGSFHDDVHFNTEGSKKVAREVADFLLRTKWFDIAAEKITP